MQDMLYLGSIMKDMDGLKVLVVTSRSSKTSLMTAIIFSSQLAVCIQSINLATKDADTQSLKFIHNDFSVQEEYRNKCRFLYGESMGGAVALLLHKKDHTFWNGAILVAPMCKVRKIII